MAAVKYMDHLRILETERESNRTGEEVENAGPRSPAILEALKRCQLLQ